MWQPIPFTTTKQKHDILGYRKVYGVPCRSYSSGILGVSISGGFPRPVWKRIREIAPIALFFAASRTSVWLLAIRGNWREKNSEMNSPKRFQRMGARWGVKYSGRDEFKPVLWAHVRDLTIGNVCSNLSQMHLDCFSTVFSRSRVREAKLVLLTWDFYLFLQILWHSFSLRIFICWNILNLLIFREEFTSVPCLPSTK